MGKSCVNYCHLLLGFELFETHQNSGVVSRFTNSSEFLIYIFVKEAINHRHLHNLHSRRHRHRRHHRLNKYVVFDLQAVAV